MTPAFQPSAEQKAVIDHRHGHLQVIACAGSGKTESISRRIAALIHEGAEPESIVAFTFTERAAAELKERILSRTAEACGEAIKGRMARMYVGTIHGYCFKLLQDHVPSYGNYDVLDEDRHAGLLARESNRLQIAKRLGLDKKWKSIEAWTQTVDVIGNELIPRKALDSTPVGELYDDYLATLDRYHVLTFALIIQKAVEELDKPAVLASVRKKLRYLVVDEYQDVNPAQEALIRKLGAAPVEVCVVGDDDQAIYQWRGSDVGNIQRFTKTFAKAKSHPLLSNRRSKREIVELAERFASTIPGRLAKKMTPQRESDPQSVVPWSADRPEDEAALIAATISDLHTKGFRYRDIGVLYRSVRTSAPVLIEALRQRSIPFSCSGRSGLFLQPDMEALGRTYAWLADWEWRAPGYGQIAHADDIESLLLAYRTGFGASADPRRLRRFLKDWKALAADSEKPVNLIRDYYVLLHELRAHELDPDVSEDSTRLGSLARFSNILADFENVTRRGRWLPDDKGTLTFTGGMDRGVPYYQALANFLVHYATSEYDEYEGEASPDLDAVDIVTVHRSKGLEWPVVFLPSLQSRRFPSSKTGQAREWHLPEAALSERVRQRYEGSDADERRLFYVAMTRARDVLYLSHFRMLQKQSKASPFVANLFEAATLPDLASLPLPATPKATKDETPPRLSVSFSELSDYEECGHRFRLSSSFGFETQLASELGYGRAIHHVLRAIAEKVRASRRLPTPAEMVQTFDAEFYLPFANKANFATMRDSARKLVERYVARHGDDLERVWATERSFEMHLPDGTLSGRADVILGTQPGRSDSLAIVDYKTSRGVDQDAVFRFQLAIYAAAGRGEGLDVTAAWVHDLSTSQRESVPVAEPDTKAAVARASKLVKELKAAQYPAKPAANRCKPCEYVRLCGHAPADPWDDD